MNLLEEATVVQDVNSEKETITLIRMIPVRINEPNTPILAQFAGVKFVMPPDETHTTITMTLVETHYHTQTATTGRVSGKYTDDDNDDMGRDR